MNATFGLSDFTGLYPLSKTLRFELKPTLKTLEHIEAKGLLLNDEARAKSYEKMKQTIDGFHKYFIELAMGQVALSYLEDFAILYHASVEKKKEKGYREAFEKVQTALRKEIVKGFSAGDAKELYSNMFKKELITQQLEAWIEKQRDENLYFDEDFKSFTTYFGGFHENRKNMYTDKPQSTAIAYRLIHENLPKFLDNIQIYEKLKSIPELYEKSKALYNHIEEHLNIHSIDEAFELDYYNETLAQRDIDIYNLIIGGRTVEEGKQKIQGLNEYINLYNQKQKDRRDRLPKLKLLYKQILSDRESTSFLQEKFEKGQDVLEAIESYYKSHIVDYQAADKEDSEHVLKCLQGLLADLNAYDLDKIYIKNDKALTDMSQAIFGDWGIIKSALEYYYNTNHTIKTKKDEEAKERFLKQNFYSIKEIEAALKCYKNEADVLKTLQEDAKPITDYFKTHFKTKPQEPSSKEYDYVSYINAKYSAIKGALNTDYPKDKELHQDKDLVGKLKEFMDAILEVLHFVKPLAVPTSSTLEKDHGFYGQFEPWYEPLQLLIPLYNKVRNYATQKPYSTEKFKLNFENSTLLDGWDVNKEEANTSILFKKDDLFYLGIMDKQHNKLFRKVPKAKSEHTYSKINYKLLPGASKMLPKVFFSKKNIDYYQPSEEILTIRNHSTHTKGGSAQKGYEKRDFNVEDCRDMIDFFKHSIEKHPEWSQFGFEFSATTSYDSIDGFYREIEAQGYTISYTDIDDTYIHQMVDEGKLYLFQIYNKDFSPYSKGTPNMHTLYWKALFEPSNLKDVVYKLNGQAEVFYRRKSIDDANKVVHKAHEPITNKNPLNTKTESRFDYDIIKDKRYTVDKFQFHVPITLNFKAKGNDFINYEVLDYLHDNPDVNIIGIDRGERHLIYLTLINQQGDILLQESLNSIVNQKHHMTTPYHALLEAKEKERAEARVNWGSIENIKELKAGYLSQVVHKIAKLMVEHHAIVVMEDLNFGFKRGRFKVEKQVYQKLEKMLIDKLNYLVFKDQDPHELGGLYNALQLTNKFKSFKEMGKQSGFLFYVPAWNTSKIDPTTGFVNLFYTKYESVEKAQAFFETFQSIRFNNDKNYFEFAFDYDDFTTRAEGTQTEWTVCTHGDRIITFRNPEANNQWDHKEVILTELFEDLLGKHGIAYGDGTDIKAEIVSQDSKEFFENLLKLLKLTLQMRNSKTGTDIDYLVSPVLNQQGEFYDSRKADESLPKDADANGAYHIAKKGLQWLEQIQNFNGDNWKKLDLDKTNKGWLRYVQGL